MCRVFVTAERILIKLFEKIKTFDDKILVRFVF